MSRSQSQPFELSAYDELPVHQTSHPFSYLPSTDYMWDDGYYVAAVCPDEALFLATGVRVNANADMVGGYCILNIAGKQFTVRFNRCWSRKRELAAVTVGPYRLEFLKPLRKLRFSLDRNDSELSFDLIWEGVSPPFLEHHHLALTRGRRSTDQSRYSQAGKVSGSLEFRGKKFTATPESWTGVRDHSWGLYADRLPLSPASALLPPKPAKPTRAFRIWSVWRSDPYSGFFHLHEDSKGQPYEESADPFGGAFEGKIYRGWSETPIVLTAVKHSTEYLQGTRVVKKASLDFVDEHGGKWAQVFDIASPPYLIVGMGYTPGSWKDGGTFHTYHGSEELALEWDEFDFSKQPVKYTPYKVTGAAASDSYGTGATDYEKPIQGVEYCSRVTTTTPEGKTFTGACQFEQYISGAYEPYGLK